MRRLAKGWTLAAALAIALGGCARSGHEGDGVGVVRAIGPERRTITLEHGDIPGLMKGMTMEFDVASPELLNDVEVGETVAFHLVHENGAYTVTRVTERKP
jgi:Cu/Ag efflux protein CusF